MSRHNRERKRKQKLAEWIETPLDVNELAIRVFEASRGDSTHWYITFKVGSSRFISHPCEDIDRANRIAEAFAAVLVKAFQMPDPRPI
jgi:hypothetical protein